MPIGAPGDRTHRFVSSAGAPVCRATPARRETPSLRRRGMTREPISVPPSRPYPRLCGRRHRRRPGARRRARDRPRFDGLDHRPPRGARGPQYRSDAPRRLRRSAGSKTRRGSVESPTPARVGLEARPADLERIDGIGETRAQTIYSAFRSAARGSGRGRPRPPSHSSTRRYPSRNAVEPR